ncbi:MAG: cyclopropane-fatty-acyl-phospholipid synthase family protein [Pseudomonadota bacterium]
MTDSGAIKSAPTSTFLENLARRALFRLFEELTVGCLVIEETGRTYQFGQDRAQARIHATIHVQNPAAWLALLRNGTVGAGESYMFGYWDTPDLLQVIRLFVLNMHTVANINSRRNYWYKLASRVFYSMRRNSHRQARVNIAAHYDLGNDFFRLFLDSSMAYSSGIFKDRAATLEQASIAKFQHICERLQLCSKDHLLEIGTGWGGLAIYAAKNFGCRVTTTTLSHEQYVYAADWIAREGLGDRITLLERDYRDLTGTYDKLVSVEMIEAVGHEYYSEYFRKCSMLLKPDGLLLIQAITISDQRYEASLTNTDFIKRYIFPGGQLPSNSIIMSNIAGATDMQVIGLEDITMDYAMTLRLWRERFNNHLAEVRTLGCDESFIRMWRFYLCFCEGGFLERVIHTGQFLAAKPDFRALPRIR